MSDVTNALAYYILTLITSVKSFIVQAAAVKDEKWPKHIVQKKVSHLKKKILLFATIQFIFKILFYFVKNIKNGIFQDYFSTCPAAAAQW